MVLLIPMEKMAISKFKARCLAVLERVRRTRKPLLVTRFGQPIAEVCPPSAEPTPQPWIGCMRDTGRILGNVVAPASDETDWESLQP